MLDFLRDVMMIKLVNFYLKPRYLIDFVFYVMMGNSLQQKTSRHGVLVRTVPDIIQTYLQQFTFSFKRLRGFPRNSFAPTSDHEYMPVQASPPRSH